MMCSDNRGVRIMEGRIIEVGLYPDFKLNEHRKSSLSKCNNAVLISSYLKVILPQIHVEIFQIYDSFFPRCYPPQPSMGCTRGLTYLIHWLMVGPTIAIRITQQWQIL